VRGLWFRVHGVAGARRAHALGGSLAGFIDVHLPRTYVGAAPRSSFLFLRVRRRVKKRVPQQVMAVDGEVCA